MILLRLRTARALAGPGAPAGAGPPRPRPAGMRNNRRANNDLLYLCRHGAAVGSIRPSTGVELHHRCIFALKWRTHTAACATTRAPLRDLIKSQPRRWRVDPNSHQQARASPAPDKIAKVSATNRISLSPRRPRDRRGARPHSAVTSKK
ncbi:hypothetical protein EVAR_27711_1 [Eumeta japonica]|uniref:Uncharacterized protein n=1 Tax=Eumeta variegata TaxID=151549 RepID=A0A4C1WN18_EUMVA|nr:hypothetical protein EVAR_27711_1 [Eumeta japonica]